MRLPLVLKGRYLPKQENNMNALIPQLYRLSWSPHSLFSNFAISFLIFQALILGEFNSLHECYMKDSGDQTLLRIQDLLQAALHLA